MFENNIEERIDLEERIDFLFKQNVKDENAVWDDYIINKTEIIIGYHYWIDLRYNKCIIRVVNKL